MTPGGITEIIWHFAGYFHLANEYAKATVIYEEGPDKPATDDYTTPRPDDSATGDLDPFTALRVRLPDGVSPADFVAQHLPLLKGLPPKFSAPPEFDDPNPGKFAPPHFSVGGSAMGHNAQFKISVSYDDEAAQTQLEIGQLNQMDDNDELLTGDADAIRALQHPDIEGTLAAMADEANAYIPDEYQFPQTTADITEFLKAHDHGVADREGPPDGFPNEFSIEPGRYVNGELEEDESEEPPANEETPAPAETPPDLGTEPGQWAVVGGNTDINAALIVDLSESARSMVVMGDYFKTNIFVQTNSYMDGDKIAAAGGIAADEIVGAGNIADNIASYVQHDGLYADLPSTFAGPKWNVNVVNGDYYDIHLILQQNWLLDNDIVVQESSDAHYEVHAGGNEQLNISEVFSGDFKYDLIIIAGSYHGANNIVQHNILLDIDVVRSASGDAVDASGLVNAGENELLNNATIAVYGENNFEDWNGKFDDLAAALANGDSTLDPSFGSLLAGNGGSFDVLYVTGDYYDINAIWQINVTADADVVIQLASDPPAYPDGDIADESADGSVTRSVASGENSLTNDAAIIDVGSTDAFVNGDVYIDTVLIQAKLIEDDDDQIVIHDTDALVSELVAFTTPAGDEGDIPPAVYVVIPQDDPMANVMH